MNVNSIPFLFRVKNNIFYSIMMSHTINIITRTSNRPNYFQQCYRSVDKQEDIGFTEKIHWITADTPETVEYVREYDHIRLQPFSRPKRRNSDHFPFHQYLNEVMKQIDNDGWVLILDDDHILSENSTLQTIYQVLLSKQFDRNRVYFWQVLHSNGDVLPELSSFSDRHFTSDEIDSGGFLFHISHRQLAKFSSNLHAEYEVALQLINHLTVEIITQVLVTNLHKGKERDLPLIVENKAILKLKLRDDLKSDDDLTLESQSSLTNSDQSSIASSLSQEEEIVIQIDNNQFPSPNRVAHLPNSVNIPILGNEMIDPILSNDTVVPILPDDTVVPILSNDTVDPILSNDTVVPILSNDKVVPILSNDTIDSSVNRDLVPSVGSERQICLMQSRPNYQILPLSPCRSNRSTCALASPVWPSQKSPEKQLLYQDQLKELFQLVQVSQELILSCQQEIKEFKKEFTQQFDSLKQHRECLLSTKRILPVELDEHNRSLLPSASHFLPVDSEETSRVFVPPSPLSAPTSSRRLPAKIQMPSLTEVSEKPPDSSRKLEKLYVMINGVGKMSKELNQVNGVPTSQIEYSTDFNQNFRTILENAEKHDYQWIGVFRTSDVLCHQNFGVHLEYLFQKLPEHCQVISLSQNISKHQFKMWSDPNEHLNVQEYKMLYPDLNTGKIDIQKHWKMYGQKEYRVPFLGFLPIKKEFNYQHGFLIGPKARKYLLGLNLHQSKTKNPILEYVSLHPQEIYQTIPNLTIPKIVPISKVTKICPANGWYYKSFQEGESRLPL